MTHRQHLAAGIAFAVTLLLACAPGASAQTTPIDEQYVVVTRPQSNPAQLRCFAGQIWYPVEFLKQGQVLRADATRDDWYRVGYPAGVPVAVTLSESRFDNTSRTVTLTDASSLQARNFGQPTSIESYKEVFDPKLPAGTVLTVVGEMHDDGKLSGYFVLPPDGAKGWVNRRHVRDATQAEIDSFLSALNTMPTIETNTDPVVAPEATPPANTETPNDPLENEPEPADLPIELTPIEMQPAQTDPAPAPAPQPESAPEQIETPATSTTDESTTPEDAEPINITPAQARAALYAKLAELDESYTAISTQQTEGAEIVPLQNEYTALRDDARAMTGDAAMARMAEYADARIMLLSLRAEVQQVQAQLAELAEQADASQLAIQSTRQGIMRARGYAMVGVLTRSSLYTGGELPLRYRLQSSSTASARTIAYIEIKEGTNVAPLLGKNVGVIVAPDGVARTGPVPILRAELVEEINLETAVSNR